MTDGDLVLLGTAASIGLVHTLIGIDHSVPFIVLSRSQQWPLRKLLAVTAGCGLLHLLSSVVIGSIGIALGVGLSRLTWLETTRGSIAARLLIGFGLAYMVWGIYRALRGRRHAHAHAHHDGTVHVHQHDHRDEHVHLHAEARARTLSMMGLFLVFVLGPCESLIPLLMAPAFERSWPLLFLVVLVFGVATLGTMLALVTLGHYGLRQLRLRTLDRHLHAIAGFAIVVSGILIEFLGV
jgi:ABC-type nickel/cobalt efflux system permease component RcnA